MLDALLLELLYKTFALAVTVWAAQYLTTNFIEGVVEFTAVYITVLDLLYRNERLPMRV